MWWGSNDELPLTTEASTLEGLLARGLEIAPEIELAPARRVYSLTREPCE